MERDSLLAHGAAYLLHDRLHACSDRHVADVCSRCGSLLAPACTLRVAGGAEATEIPLWKKMLCGLSAGGIAATLCCQVEVALVRLQVRRG